MKIYRIMGMHGHTTIPWQIREKMDLKASDVISFEYGAFGDDIILVRRELVSESDGIPDRPDLRDARLRYDARRDPLRKVRYAG